MAGCIAIATATISLILDGILKGGLTADASIWFMLIPLASSLILGKIGTVVGLVLVFSGLLISHFFALEVPMFIHSKGEYELRIGIACLVVTLLLLAAFYYQHQAKDKLLKQISKALEDKNSLVTIICHDIANPLLAINNGAIHLKEKIDDMPKDKRNAKIDRIILGHIIDFLL